MDIRDENSTCSAATLSFEGADGTVVTFFTVGGVAACVVELGTAAGATVNDGSVVRDAGTGSGATSACDRVGRDVCATRVVSEGDSSAFGSFANKAS